MADPKPYTLAQLEDAPVDDIWGTNSTRIVVTKESVAATINDNARLRALIKEAEMAAMDRDRCAECPWCEMGNPHAVDCPAFTPEGEVR